MLGRLRERLSRHEFLKHVLVLMSGTAVAQILPIAASPIISRMYSPHEVGVYTAFMSLVAGLITLASWRYDLAIVLPKDVEDARALVKLANRLSAITCVVVGLVLMILAGPISEALRAPDLRLWIGGVGVVAWAFSQVSIFNYWCNRNKQYKLMSTNRIGQSITTTGTQLGLGAFSVGTTGLIVSTFLGQLVAAGNLFRKTRKEIYGLPSSPARKVMAAYKKMPLLNGPTAMLDTVRLNGTQLMIQFFFSSAALGQFGQAWKMLQTPAGLINSSLSQVFFQKLSVTPRGQMLRVVKTGIVRSALIGVVPFVLIYFLSPPLFPIIFGARWAQAGQIGAALVPWLYMNFITSPISMLFVVTQRQGALFWFGIPFTAAPLALLVLLHTDILQTMVWLSLLMAGLLGVFLLLALWVAAGYDRGVGASADATDELSIAETAALENELTDDVDGH
ncbi:MAG TPA: lipopolysaccharide biosynthesis protein [Arachnia sp.]|nr:lipopolysaccharide biosynthesis protein [Arachnia sp.]